jgi:hypothetical protein
MYLRPALRWINTRPPGRMNGGFQANCAAGLTVCTWPISDIANRLKSTLTSNRPLEPQSDGAP